MPLPTLTYAVTSTGVTVPTQAQLLAFYQAVFLQVYATDLTVQDVSSPDNQLVNILVQANLDNSDFTVNVFNSFNPDNAFGTVLDQRVGLNGIQRLAGTYTTTMVTVVTTQALNLYGLDQTLQPVYTASDNAGNQWELLVTQNISSAGTYSFIFQSSVPGAVLTIPNTITIPVTITLGVSSLNNPSTYISLGVNEETDAALKIRRQASVSLPSQGYLSGLLAALENIPGLTYAYVEENTTGSTNTDGVPGHSIWVIVAGSAASLAIATAIYTKRNAGCGMYGSISYPVTQADGSSFSVNWDTVVTVPVFTKFNVTSLNGTTPPNIAAIKAGLPASFTPGVATQINTNELSTIVQGLDSNALVSSAGFSLTSGGTYTATLTPALKKNQFVFVSNDTIILTMILAAPGVGYSFTAGVVTQTTVTVAHGGSTLQFTGLGGYGALTYSKTSGAGSISSSGLYTSSTAGTDVLLVTDSLSNTAQCTVTVS